MSEYQEYETVYEEPEYVYEEQENDIESMLAEEPERRVGFQQQQHMGLIDPIYGTGIEGLRESRGAEKIRYAEIPREKLYLRDLYFALSDVFSDPETVSIYMKSVEAGIPRYWTKNPYVLSKVIELLQFNDKIDEKLLNYKSKESKIPKADLLRYIFLVQKHLNYGDKTGLEEEQTVSPEIIQEKIPKQNIVKITKKNIDTMDINELYDEFIKSIELPPSKEMLERYNAIVERLVQNQVRFSLKDIFEKANNKVIDYWIQYPKRNIYFDEIIQIKDRVLFRNAFERFYVEFIYNLGKDANIKEFVATQLNKSSLTDEMKKEKMFIMNDFMKKVETNKKWVKDFISKFPMMKNLDFSRIT